MVIVVCEEDEKQYIANFFHDRQITCVDDFFQFGIGNDKLKEIRYHMVQNHIILLSNRGIKRTHKTIIAFSKILFSSNAKQKWLVNNDIFLYDVKRINFQKDSTVVESFLLNNINIKPIQSIKNSDLDIKKGTYEDAYQIRPVGEFANFDQINWIIAYDNNIPVGRVALIMRSNQTAVFHYAFISFDYRNQGIYKSLVERRLDIAKENNIKTILAYCNQNSLPILKKIGFKEMGYTNPKRKFTVVHKNI